MVEAKPDDLTHHPQFPVFPGDFGFPHENSVVNSKGLVVARHGIGLRDDQTDQQDKAVLSEQWEHKDTEQLNCEMHRIWKKAPLADVAFSTDEIFHYTVKDTEEIRQVPDDLLQLVFSKGRRPPEEKKFMKDGREDLSWMGMDNPNLPRKEPMSSAAVEYQRKLNLPPPWNIEAIKQVVAQGPNGPDIHTYHQQWTAMWWAAKLKMWDEVLQLLELGADPNAVDEYEYSAMMWAVRCSRMDVVQKLIDKGGDINQMTQYGFTVYMFAKKYCEDDTPNNLLELGAIPVVAKPWEDGCPDKFSWSYRHSQGWPSTGPRKPWEQIGMEGAKVWDHHLKAWHDKVARDAKEKEEKEAEEAAKKAAEEAGAPAAEPVS